MEDEKAKPPFQEDDVVSGYAIRNSVVFTNDRGFAFAENVDRMQSFVTWQFTEDNGHRDYYWGHYHQSRDKALEDFKKRVDDYKKDYGLSEKPVQRIPRASILNQLVESKRQSVSEPDLPKNTKQNHEREV